MGQTHHCHQEHHDGGTRARGRSSARAQAHWRSKMALAWMSRLRFEPRTNAPNRTSSRPRPKQQVLPVGVAAPAARGRGPHLSLKTMPSRRKRGGGATNVTASLSQPKPASFVGASRRTPIICASRSPEASASRSAMSSRCRSAAPTIATCIKPAMKSDGGRNSASSRCPLLTNFGPRRTRSQRRQIPQRRI